MLDAILAQARRWHAHIAAGGTVSQADMAWLVRKLEALQAAPIEPAPQSPPAGG